MSGGFSLFGECCNANTVGTVSATSLGTGMPNYNTWTQLTASTPSDATWVVVTITYDGAVNWQTVVDIGIGGAGSEIAIISSLLCYIGGKSYAFPVSIPAGTRISARPTYSQGATTCVSMTLLDGPFIGTDITGIDTIGFSSGSQNGTTMTPNASANTKGSYGQLVASTARDYLGFVAHLDWDNSTVTRLGKQYLCDIAIGGAGSEVIIVPDIPTLINYQTPAAFYPISIPAGTRIAGRCQANYASGLALFATLYGIYQ